MPELLPLVVDQPVILHDSQGLHIRKNAKNSFTVVRLHYTADPAKCSLEWKKVAQAGMTPARWAKEYEIDATALYGVRVFPEFMDNRAKIVVKSDGFELPENLRCWGGFDYGLRNPSSFHVYTIWDKCVYSIWELFEPCRNVPEFANKMMACPYWDKIRYIAADQSMWSLSQQNKIGAPSSIYNEFVEAKISKLVKGNRDDQAFIAKIRAHWANADDPTFRILDLCVNQLREFEGAVYPSMSEIQLQHANFKEIIVDKNNHSLDDAKYFFNSQPRAGAASPVKSPAAWGLRRWLH